MKLSLLSLLVLTVYSCGVTSKKVAPKNERKIKHKENKILEGNFGPSVNDGQFLDVTTREGLSDFYASRLYVYDFNNDGKEDIALLEDSYSTPLFLLRSKDGFSRSKTIRFIPPVKASFLNFTDIDKDGVVDALVAVHNQKTSLTKSPIRIFMGAYTREGLVFKLNEKYKFKSNSPVSSVSLLDYDYDGELDFFVGNWFDLKSKKKSQIVSDNLYTYKNGKLHDVSGALTDEKKIVDKSSINATPTYSVSHCDVDGDGLVDILTSSSAGYKNKLWIAKYNKSNNITKYINYGDESGFSQDDLGKKVRLGGGSSTYSLCTDYNNDTFMDIAVGEVSHSYDIEEKDRSSILTGQGLGFPPTFIRSEYISDQGLINWNQVDQRAVWSDLNNDGLVDLIVENSGFPPHTKLISFIQDQDHGYQDQSKALGLDIVNPIATVTLDYNGDGREDILVAQSDVRNKGIKKRLYLFENNIKSNNNYISIKLVGKFSHVSAIGSKVVVTTIDGREQTRWYQVNYGGFPSQNSSYIHFGLGTSEIKKIDVYWPYRNKNKLSHSTYFGPFARKSIRVELVEK